MAYLDYSKVFEIYTDASSKQLGAAVGLLAPKPEIQHDRRGRGVPTLTREEVTIREGIRRCCSCTKKKIIRLLNDSKLALNQWVKKGVYCVESYMIPNATLKRLRWPTSPAEKEATYNMGVNVQSNC